MDMIWNIFEVLINIIEAFIAVRFVLKFQGYNFSLPSTKLKYIYASLGFAALTTALNYIVPYGGVLEALYILYMLVISFLFVDSKVSAKIFASVFVSLISLVVATATTATLSVTFHIPLDEIFTEMSWVRFFGLIAVQLIKLFIFDILLNVMQRNGLKLGKKEWTLILTVFVLSFVAIQLMQDAAVKATANSELYFLSEACSIIIAAVCFYMTILLSKSQRESERLRLAAQQEEFRAQYAQNVKKQYEEISRVRHDMKQTHSVVMSLLMEAKADEAIEYMQRAAQKISEFDVIVDVGNDFVNAILNAKLSEAKRGGIMVLCSADKNAAGIDEVDMCNLLGNLLDNAIEACEKCSGKQRIIEIKLRARDDKYILEVENTAPENALESNKRLATTKDDASRHGYGVKSIKSIAEKYNGMVNFLQDGERFKSTVILSTTQ